VKSTSILTKILAAALAMNLLGMPVLAQQSDARKTSQQSSGFTFRVQSDLVLVNVVAHDKSGNLVRDLKQDDFTVLEDGKPQRILSFDIEKPEIVAQSPETQAAVQGTAPSAPSILSNVKVAPEAVRDRRLIVIFFDLSSMQPEEIERAVKAAQAYVAKQMSPADLVSIITLGDSMEVAQDFTTDRDALDKALAKLNPGEGQGFENGDTGDSEGTPDTGAQFTADDTEYNLFNTDRRLMAINSLAQSLAKIEQKKSVLYFSGGLEKTGVENESQLRAAINSAVRANVSLYTVDIRGLQALPPGGDAGTASLRGTSAYSGRAVQNDLDSNFASQETLSTLAVDTGGKAFLDSNDFSRPFTKVQEDTASYYVLGYRSTNKAMDGRYRHITVRVNRKDIKLQFRSGYYGPRDFAHYSKDDREQQLQDEIASDFPSTDLPVYLEAGYFRAQDGRYFVPVSIVVPGSAIPAMQLEDKSKASLDVMGIVREATSKFPVGSVRDTVKIPLGAQPGVRKNVQYNTGFLLSPGTYHLKFVVRENLNGQMGTFETDFTVPDLKKAPLKMSTVLLSNQRGPAGKDKQNPLVKDGAELLPNLAHVFSSDQRLTFYYEVYDPGKQKGAARNTGVRVLTSIQFFRGKVKAYETPLVQARELNDPSRDAATFQLEVPLSELRPGWYTCQVNVIDDVAGSFSFPRMPILVREPKPTATAASLQVSGEAAQTHRP
jgi:VWFA-related protein